MSSGLDAVSRLRRQRADDAKLTLVEAQVGYARASEHNNLLRRALGAGERALHGHRVALSRAPDVTTMRAVEACMRAQRDELARLRQRCSEAEARLAEARVSLERVRSGFSSDERDARAVERVIKNTEASRVRQHTMRAEVDHEDAARFRSRG